MLLDLVKYSSLLVLLGTHLSHLLEDSRMGGGECLKGTHKGAKLQSRDGDGRLRCSGCDWWNRRSHRESSKSSLRRGHWWCSLCQGLALLWLWGHWRCYHGRGSWRSRIARQLIPFVESESLSTNAATLESRLNRKAYILQDLAQQPRE